MKFEEVLPKMREGKIGKVGEYLFKLSEYGLIWKKSHSSWTRHPRMLEEFLERDDWSLEPIKVKKWQWVFGSDAEIQAAPAVYLTEEKAEKYRVAYEYDWMERIDHTMIEGEE